MKNLDAAEVLDIMSQGRNAAEHVLVAMLDGLETEHPGVYRVILRTDRVSKSVAESR